MKKDNLSLALGNISSEHIEEAMRFEVEANRHSPKKSWTHLGALAAACFILLACLIPVMHSLEWNPPIVGSTTKHPSSTPSQESTKNPSHTTAPDTPDDGKTPGATPPLSVDYPTLEAAHAALGYTTLYENILLDNADYTDISIIYDAYSSKPDESVGGAFSTPRQMLIDTSFTDGKQIDQVEYYIIFGSNTVDDSYIGGYTEQNRKQEIGGITVHFSIYKSGDLLRSHAKFIYEGNLYVIHVTSHEREDITTESAPTLPLSYSPLFAYLNQILNQQSENQ